MPTREELEKFDSYVLQYKNSPWAPLYNIESFLENLEEIRSHNSILEGFSLGINLFTGVSKKEVLDSIRGQTSDIQGSAYSCPKSADIFHSIIPVLETNWDWRD